MKIKKLPTPHETADEILQEWSRDWVIGKRSLSSILASCVSESIDKNLSLVQVAYEFVDRLKR